MGYDDVYTGREIIKLIKEAPDIDYVGEFLIGCILGYGDIKDQEKLVSNLDEHKEDKETSEKSANRKQEVNNGNKDNM